MIQEAYVSYEVSKLLKEKGFDEPFVNYYYTTKGERVGYLMAEEQYLCPTHQMAMAWLREAHNIFIEIIIFRENMIHYRFKILNRNCEKIYIDSGSQFSYEEAVEAALKYALENLI